MVPGSEVATVLDVACTRNDVGWERSLSVLHGQPGREIRQIVCARSIRVVLLRDAECSQTHRLQEKLREVGPDQITRREPAEQSTRRNLTVHFGASKK